MLRMAQSAENTPSRATIFADRSTRRRGDRRSSPDGAVSGGICLDLFTPRPILVPGPLTFRDARRADMPTSRAKPAFVTVGYATMETQVAGALGTVKLVTDCRRRETKTSALNNGTLTLCYR